MIKGYKAIYNVVQKYFSVFKISILNFKCHAKVFDVGYFIHRFIGL